MMKACFLVSLIFTFTASAEYAFISTRRSFLLHNGKYSFILPFSPPDSRDRHVVEFLEDRVIVCNGGPSWVGPFTKSCYQLSPNCSGWISHSREARYQAASSALGGGMFIMGGYEYPEPDHLQASGSIEKYDVRKGYWSMSTLEMPNARKSHCAVAIDEHNIMLIGGYPDWNEAHILNTEDGYWTKLPDSIHTVGASGCAVGMLSGHRGVFVAGGVGSQNKAQFFDIKTQAWEVLADLNTGGDPLTMATVNGVPLVFGDGSSVEIFDGSVWNVIDNNFLGDDLEGSTSTTIPEGFVNWLLTVSSVDWSENNTCGNGGDISDGKLELANMYQDHMVFQRAPNNPQIWGFGTPGKIVTVKVLDSLGNDVTTGSPEAYVEDNEEFKISIGSYSAGTGFTIFVQEAFDGDQFLVVTLNDVAFGEVWVCSGQSNMEVKIKDIRDSDIELDTAETYENVRLLKPSRQTAKTPQRQVLGFYNSWSKPRKEFLASGKSFSAICLIFGEHLNDVLGVPIGLIDSTWGGTIIEAWSPPESLAYCEINDDGIGDGHNHNEYLWNAMIHPFLRHTIKGVIWYQGEQNAGYPFEYPGHNRDLYSCSFPSMIENWRVQWARETGGDVDRKFPFGFVQLAPFTNQRDHLAWPELRWYQTGDYGYVPNERMENVFMAVAADDDISLHPVNKRLPATRLAWAASNIAYGDADTPFMGPQPVKVSFKTTNRDSLIVTYDTPIEDVTPEADRFMVCCLATPNQCDKAKYGQGWEGISISSSTDTIVELDASAASCGSSYSGLAYLWLETPCSGENNCPIYSNDGYRLPAAPWKTTIDRKVCSLDKAYDGDYIQIMQTGEKFLLRDTQVRCHAACQAHPLCQFYQWYESLSQNNANKCFLLENQNKEVNDEFLQYGSKTCDWLVDVSGPIQKK